MNQLQSMRALSKVTGLSQKELELLFEQVATVAVHELREGGSGALVFPGIGKLRAKEGKDGRKAIRFLVFKKLKEAVMVK